MEIKLKDLLGKRNLNIWDDETHIVSGTRIIGFDTNGKKLFDSSFNNEKHISKYAEGRVSSVWAGIIPRKTCIYQNEQADAAIMMYIHHNTWKD